jgi:hypothetical protein
MKVCNRKIEFVAVQPPETREAAGNRNLSGQHLSTVRFQVTWRAYAGLELKLGTPKPTKVMR